MLKLQPNNAEAIAELASLLPPDRPSPKPNIKKLTTPSPGSSSSAPVPPSPSSSSSLQSKSGSGAAPTKKKEQSKQLPWARTKADERRLKVILIPASAAEIAFEEYGKQYAREAAAASGCTHPHHPNRGAGTGKNKGKAAASAAGKRTSGNAGSKNSRIREMEEIMRAETVVYPSWDRYIVKKVD